MSQPPNTPSPVLIDRPEISELYADGLGRVFFDGACIRMEFYVTRYEEVEGEAEPKPWTYTAARVVVSMRGAAEMINRLRHLEAMLVRRGVIQSAAPGRGPAVAPPEGDA